MLTKDDSPLHRPCKPTEEVLPDASAASAEPADLEHSLCWGWREVLRRLAQTLATLLELEECLGTSCRLIIEVGLAGRARRAASAGGPACGFPLASWLRPPVRAVCAGEGMVTRHRAVPASCGLLLICMEMGEKLAFPFHFKLTVSELTYPVARICVLMAVELSPCSTVLVR